MEEKVKYNIGSGGDIIEGYVSVDLYANADIKDDITKLTTIKDNSVDEVLTTHVLEHLSDKDVFPAMYSIYRILKPGGEWLIEVPDLIWVLKDFMDTPDQNRWGWKLQTIFGLQCHNGEYHRTGFSDWRLGQMLKEVGFTNIQIETSFSEHYNQGVINAIVVKPNG